MPPFDPQQQSNPIVHLPGSLGASVLWQCARTGAALVGRTRLAYQYLYSSTRSRNAGSRFCAVCFALKI